MKNLILLYVLFVPLLIIAQNNPDKKNAKINEQTNQLMIKIASDPEMRGMMMDLIIERTKGNKEETSKYVNALINNPETSPVILASPPQRTENLNISTEPRGMTKDSTRVMKMYNTIPVPRK